jgi:hypothetical protein
MSDFAFVWWNTGWVAPSWAGEHLYVAEVHSIRPYTGPLDFIDHIAEVDASITSRRRRTEISVERDNPRFLWRTHPCNPEIST